MPITSIIFSKDRPLQLDLLLSSMEKCDVNDVFEEKIVIYKCSNLEYEKAYKKLPKEYPNVSFWEQSESLFKDVDVAVSCSLSPYIAFFTDDNIFYNDILLTQRWIDGAFGSEVGRLSHISLRLGENTQYRSGAGIEGMFKQEVGDFGAFVHPRPLATEWERLLYYDRSIHYYGGYWNYPISLDGHIFQQSVVQAWTEELCYLDKIKKWKQNPNELERALQRFCQECPPFVIMPPLGCVVNSPNNQVSDYFNHDESVKNISGETYPLQADRLLEDFNNGYRVCYKTLKKAGHLDNIICAHQEINILDAMIKEERTTGRVIQDIKVLGGTVRENSR